MNRSICTLLALFLPAALAADDDESVRKELKALQGKWKAVSFEAGGKQLPKGAALDFTFVVGADGKAVGKTPQTEYEAAIVLDPKKNPKTIDNVHKTGAQKGKKQFGVYKLSGDKWTVCMTRPGASESDRPKSFDTKDKPCVTFVFERVKEDKKP